MLGMLLFSAYMISVQRIKTLIGFREMTLAPHKVKTFRNNKWEEISSYLLRPGDIVIVEPGYQHNKIDHKPVTDE